MSDEDTIWVARGTPEFDKVFALATVTKDAVVWTGGTQCPVCGAQPAHSCGLGYKMARWLTHGERVRVAMGEAAPALTSFLTVEL